MDDLHRLECVAFRYIRWEVIIEDLAEAGHRNSNVARCLALWRESYGEAVAMRVREKLARVWHEKS